MSEKPIYILPENTSRILGKDAQRNNILAAKVIADIVKTTLGPKGMDKMLVDSSGNIIVTNDGVTILEEMEIDHPAAKMMVEIARAQENEVGDGTTTVALLAGKLLENAEKLLDKKIHPTVIIKGYKLAAEYAIAALDEISSPVSSETTLKQIAMTAMTGKGAEGNKEKLADLVVKAISQVGQGKAIDLDNIKIGKIKGDSISNSELVNGIVLEKERANQDMPSHIENAKIALVDFALEIRNPETEAKISISSPEQLQSFIESEEHYLRELTNKIIKSGANVILCQKGIDDVAQYYLAKARITAYRRVTKSDMEKIAKATSTKIISNINDLNESQLGKAKTVEEIKRGDEVLTYISGCLNPAAVTIMAHGPTSHIVDEIERAIKDALGDAASAIKDNKIVAGGGAVEMELSKRLRHYAKTLGGREQLAIEEFASSLESIPEALAENAGLDPINTLAELKSRHESNFQNHGLNLFTNQIEDTLKAGIIEPRKVKTQAISSASEIAMMLLRIDDVLISRSSSPQARMPQQYDGLD